MSFNYAQGSTVLVCNASAALQLPAPSSASLQPVFSSAQPPQTVFVLPLSAPESNSSSDIQPDCAALDLQGSGLCNVSVSLTAAALSPLPTVVGCVSYSAPASLSYGSPVTVSAPAAAPWLYYSVFVQAADLPVTFSLSQQQSGSAQLFLSYQSSPLSPFVSGSNASVQSFTLPPPSASSSYQPGVYILGVYGAVTAAQLLLLSSSALDSAGSDVSYGYNILSVLALILAIALIFVVLCRVSLLYRARAFRLSRSNRRFPATAGAPDIGDIPALEDDGIDILDVISRERAAAAAGQWRPGGRGGATAADIAALPVHVFAGAEKFDEGRCAVCLEDYLAGSSRLSTLPCGHSFDSSCIALWLRERSHCPLCLRTLDGAAADQTNKPAVTALTAATRPASISPRAILTARTAAVVVPALQDNVERDPLGAGVVVLSASPSPASTAEQRSSSSSSLSSHV